ncbi:hypothetical protein LTSERUB_4436, partial [Salmonella enterica subsp. enterica serovar Rubislaw str. A4-653]
MPPKHSRTCPTHNLLHLLAFSRLIAVHRAL